MGILTSSAHRTSRKPGRGRRRQLSHRQVASLNRLDATDRDPKHSTNQRNRDSTSRSEIRGVISLTDHNGALRAGNPVVPPGGVWRVCCPVMLGASREGDGLPDDIVNLPSHIYEWLAQNLSLQVDPVSALVATLALVVAIGANRQARRMRSDERNRAGNISRVSIQEHSLQAAPREEYSESPQRITGSEEGFVCSVHSGDTEVEVDSVYLKIVFVRGLFGQQRWEVRVDLSAMEGLAIRPTPLPHRMRPHARLDWILPPFVSFFPRKRGDERRVGLLRVMVPNEQLRIEFGAYSRVGVAPITARSEHELRILGFPLRGGPWTRVEKRNSLWDALADPDCPDSLRAWFLEWLECRSDFSSRIAEDSSEALLLMFHNVLVDNYWPPGEIALLFGDDVKIGDPKNNATSHRFARTFFALPDNSPVGSGHVVSGPGGSSRLSQFRLNFALQVLNGQISPNDLREDDSWPRGLGAGDPTFKNALEARRLVDLKHERQLIEYEEKTLQNLVKSLAIEVGRCTYMPVWVGERVVRSLLNLQEGDEHSGACST